MVAYASDILLAVKGESIREAENLTNIEMEKIIKWATNNKINFNENKSKVMLITKEEERK